MPVTREVVRVNQAQDLERNTTWAQTLVGNANVMATTVFPAVTGFSGVNDVLLSCLVDLIAGKGTITITVDQSPDGTSWTTVATFSFDDRLMARGGGADRKLVLGPNDQLRVTATVAGGNWFIRAVTGVLGILESAGGAGGNMATDPLWDTAGDLAVGSGPDTAQKFPIGAQGQILSVDTTLPLKLKCINPPSVGTSITTSPYWQITSTGEFDWAPGNSVWDTKLYRLSSGVLRTDGYLSVYYGISIDLGNSASRLNFGTSADVFLYRQDANNLRTNVHLIVDGNIAAGTGTVYFGNAYDTVLYRNGPGGLKTDGTFSSVSFLYAGWNTSGGNRWGVTLNSPTDGLTLGGDTQLHRQGAGTIGVSNLWSTGFVLASSQMYIRSDSAKINLGVSDDTWIYRKSATVIGFHTTIDAEANVYAFNDRVSIGNISGVPGLVFDGASFSWNGSVLIANVPIQATSFIGPVSSQTPATGPTPPASPARYSRWIYDQGDIHWEFIYRDDLDATYPWHFVGGAPAETNTTGFDAAITVPRAGMYRAWGGGSNLSTGGGGDAYVIPPHGTRSPGGTNWAANYGSVTSTVAAGASYHTLSNPANGGTGNIGLAVIPVKIA